MKILYISPKLPFPLDEGGKIAIFGEIKYLALKGHKIDLVTYSKITDSDDSIKKVNEFCDIHFIDHSTENSFVGMFKNLFSDIPYNLSKYHSPKLMNFLKDYLNNNDVDIIQISNLHMGFVVDELRKYTSAKIILRQQNVEGQIMKRFFEMKKNPIVKNYAKLQYKRFLNYEADLCAKFDHVVFITQNDMDYLTEQNGTIKGSVIPAGIEKDYLNFTKENIEEFSMFHTGSLKWLPNLDSAKYFIESILPLIVNQEPKVKFYLYGGILPKSFEIPEQVKSNVIQKGFVDDLWGDLRNKSLAVVPLRVGSGMRLKVIELMASGNLIVTTSIGAEGIGAVNKEHLFVEDSPENFAEKCLELIRNRDEHLEIISNAKKFVLENYTWESIIEKFELIYKQN